MSLAIYQEDNKPPVVIPGWKVPFLLVHSYLWNVIRRPLVNYWKQQIEQIATRIQTDLKTELLPEVYDNLRNGCPKCKDLYFYFRQAIYVSHIRTVLKNERCETHRAAFQSFLILHENLFKLNHELSDRVCGFKSYYQP